MAEKEKVVLAYSGGLDTSCCIKWLQVEKNLDVIAVVGEVGQEHNGLEKIKDKALRMGAIECRIVDMRQDFADNVLTKAIAANAMYENKYPLISALSRPEISKYLVDVAHETGAKYVAHGCTGKGNDQVRFETSITMLDPELIIIAPLREWDLKTRPQEMEWAAENGVDVPTTKASPYSIDDNLFGRAIECGILENPWNEPPMDIYTMTTAPEDAPDKQTYVEVSFTKGVPTAIDGKKMGMVEMIETMNDIAGSNGYGRIDIIENRLVGVKSRECYEAPAAMALIVAHKALEDLCLERELLHNKLEIEHRWAIAVYNGQWFGPLKEAFDAFIGATQKYITGVVRLRFYKGNCVVVGRKSAYSLYDYRLATYDESDEFNHAAAAGFTELFGLSSKVWAANRRYTGTHGKGANAAMPAGTTNDLVEDGEVVLV